MESNSLQRGKFISFEGSEGCGKSTQVRRFVDWLRASGREVLVTREPGGTVAGEKIRHLLQHDPEMAGLVPEAELLLFAASRAQLVREVVRPALESGTWVVADRFHDSTRVYQGAGRGLDREVVDRVNDFVVGDTRPELTFLLDLDAATGHARAIRANGEGPDRMEAEDLSFFETVRRAYLDLAAAEPDRIVVVDASAPVEVVFENLVRTLEERLLAPQR